MEKYGFEVRLNDTILCKAGLDSKHSVTTCILDSLRRKVDEKGGLHLSVSGMNSDEHQYVKWIDEPLKLDDTVSIKIISGEFDTPISKTKVKSEKEILEGKLKQYHKLKEELKEYL